MRNYPLLLFILVACTSQPPKPTTPEWVGQPTRVVDNGYIVYVGTGEEMNPDRALFKAEGQALEDLANECSVIPKGTRIEDRFTKKPQYATTAYVKIAVDFPACEQAKNANDPAAIRRVGSPSFTAQLKRYQDWMETGALEQNADVATVPPESWPAAPAASASTSPEGHFFAYRQYYAYQKEIVILSPPQYYAPNAPETIVLNKNLTASSQQITQIVTANPQIAKSPQTWSTIPQRPVMQKPSSLQAAPPKPNPAAKPLNPPGKPAAYRQQNRGQQQPASPVVGRKRKKHNWDEKQ